MALKPEIPAEEQEKKMALYGASLVEQAEKQMEDVQRWLKDGEEVSIQFGKRATIQGGMCPFIKSYTLVALGRKNPIKFSDFLEMRQWLQYRERTELANKASQELAAKQQQKVMTVEYKDWLMAKQYGMVGEHEPPPPNPQVLNEGHLRALRDQIAAAEPPPIRDMVVPPAFYDNERNEHHVMPPWVEHDDLPF